MGSSRAFVHFNPRIIDSVLHVNSYNLGFNASLVNRQIGRYETFCRIQNCKPKYIVYSVDYMTLNFRDDFEREQFYPYFFYDRELMRTFDKYQHFTAFEKYVPFARYCRCFLDFHVYEVFTEPYDYSTFYKGFWNEHKEYDASEFALVDHLDYSCKDEAWKIFDEYLKKVTDDGIKVIFVYAPLYHELIPKINGFERMYDVYGRFAQKYDIPILDYTYDELSSDSNFFYNATHLNKVGADIFSKKVSEDIKQLGIISNK